MFDAKITMRISLRELAVEDHAEVGDRLSPNVSKRKNKTGENDVDHTQLTFLLKQDIDVDRQSLR